MGVSNPESEGRDSQALFFERLRQLYAEMERGYERAAETYGFNCSGCVDNCCLTHFHHHTHVERLLLIDGFKRLPVEQQSAITERALNVCREMGEADNQPKKFGIMCPLNVDGRCCLYVYRPMICRLHGIPHELSKPGRVPVQSPGCEEFVRRHGNMPYIKFDRTPYYYNLVRLESEFKQALGFTDKTKMTVAEILTCLS